METHKKFLMFEDTETLKNFLFSKNKKTVL